MMVAALCATFPGLIPSQVKQCQTNPNAMVAVIEGTRRGLNECQIQFANERWNCTPNAIVNKIPATIYDRRSNTHSSNHHQQQQPHGQVNYNNFNPSNSIHNTLQASNSPHNSIHNYIDPSASSSLYSYSSYSSSSSPSSSPSSSSSSVIATASTWQQLNLNNNNVSNKNFQLLEYPIFNQTIKHDSRETAFLYAITSAGVVHSITEACSSGNLNECSCDRSLYSMPMNSQTSSSFTSPLSSSVGSSTNQMVSSYFSPSSSLPSSSLSSSSSPSSSMASPSSSSAISDGWKWGGCSDNVRYGMAFAKKFIDAPDRRLAKSTGHLKFLMNLHNNNVGRSAVSNNMELRCRCHGISGSCELKTCWRSLPSFSSVGKYLKEKYESAVQINEKWNVKKKPRSNRPEHEDLIRRGNKKLIKFTLTNVHRDDLVYIKKSPNYCIEDRSNGILGTSGRICSKTSDGPDSCQLLCCGRGYNTYIRKVTSHCRCKFEWCCHVHCEICDTETEVYTCK